VVPPERTVGHFGAGAMPMVYATPMMILEMELASWRRHQAGIETGLDHRRHRGRHAWHSRLPTAVEPPL